ncbi:hypothetical protein IEO21_04477 [Rhodonia placenta]|uniref:Endonuclease/exonuclease/phosphatase domain-containing protein n=1 Tax=Rhodonia placenta TaxID=104341 RepID=A0A8H7U373_9APHY|nr:hypothetical protein IEO21_04477 [Postia placenta]
MATRAFDHDRCGARRPVTGSVALLDAVARADEEAVLRSLESGADVNASDTSGRTVISCAIAGDSWEKLDVSDASYQLQSRLNILHHLLGCAELSLHTLNAPVRGVSPLCLAAWLDVPEIVRLLVECSDGLVSVNATDTYGATPLMYAARDSRVRTLAHDARPDYWDVNYRTSNQYALRHPYILWLCEQALRRFRLREPMPYFDRLVDSTSSMIYDPDMTAAATYTLRGSARPTETLVQAVITADLQQLRSLLFSPRPSSIGSTLGDTPVLVNLPDSTGWSPIHYCVSAERPSVEVLDILYRAGADHLVSDLRAPLAARDSNGNTCLHIAAQYGKSVDVVAALLACDPSGTIADMRNANGRRLTALEVANPELRIAFGVDSERIRSMSSASTRTIRPSTATSVKSMPPRLDEGYPSPPLSARLWKNDNSEADVDYMTLPLQILDNLRSVSTNLADMTSLDVTWCTQVLKETSSMRDRLLPHLRSRMRDTVAELRSARKLFQDVYGLYQETSHSLVDVLGSEEWNDPQGSSGHYRRRTTDSNDSDVTAVSDASYVLVSRKCRSMTDLKLSRRSESSTSSGIPLSPVPSSPSTTTLLGQGGPRIDRTPVSSKESSPSQSTASSIRQLTRKRSHTWNDSKSAAQSELGKKGSAPSNASKLKAWLKKLMPELASKSDSAPDGRSRSHILGMRMRNVSTSSRADGVTFTVLSMCRRCMDASCQDLTRIEACLDVVEQYITCAKRAITHAEARLTKAIESWRNQPIIMRQDDMSDSSFIEGASTNRPRVQSASSSIASISSTLIEGDDDDTRVFRRLISNKVEVWLDDSEEEVDKAIAWLRIVKDGTFPANAVSVAEIQGASFQSPLAGSIVQDVTGVVTAKGRFGSPVGINSSVYGLAKDKYGVWIMGDSPSDDPRVSNGLRIYGSSALKSVSLGDRISLSGRVTEYRANYSPNDLFLTELDLPHAVTVLSHDNLVVPLVLGEGRTPPIGQLSACDVGPDGWLSVPNNVTLLESLNATLQPDLYGLDFWESLEGQLVTIPSPVAANFPDRFGSVWVYDSDNTAYAHPGAILIGHPLDNTRNPRTTMGTTMNDITGIVTYQYGSYYVLPLTAPKILSFPTSKPEPASVVSSTHPCDITIGDYNVENMGPRSHHQSKIAEHIIDFLNAPNIVFVQEIQDDSGTKNDGTAFVDTLLAHDANASIIAGGDMNEFLQTRSVFAALQGLLRDINEIAGLPPAERYTYVYDQHAQEIDHIFVSPAIAARGADVEHVHMNTWAQTMGERASDHDPSVARVWVCESEGEAWKEGPIANSGVEVDGQIVFW